MANITIAQITALFKEQDHRLQNIELLTQLLATDNHYLKDKILQWSVDYRAQLCD